MAEVKNAFIKSKMNKDLDARLIPSGEYRDAINAQVSKSEGADVGALENALGNAIVNQGDFSVKSGLASGALKSIGYLADESSGNIYVFLTDNTPDTNPLAIYKQTGAGSNHCIYKYNTNTNESTKLIDGAFLNFYTLNPIHGVNLLENLLFFTDNRNQPRKINVVDAETVNYYTSEDQISVATYNPYAAIELFKESTLSAGNYETTMKDVVSKFLPNGGTAICSQAIPGNADTVVLTNGSLSMRIYPNEPREFQKVSRLYQGVLTPVGVVDSYTTGTRALKFKANITVLQNDELFIIPNPYYNSAYNGDPRFLEDKFVRFSYRFKFESGEYSIIAPFTQPCFIPKQDGYFLNESELKGDQDQAVDSTIVDFMENKVNEIGLIIPLPSAANTLKGSFHIQEVDILYKESDGLALKVVETIPIATISALGTSTYYTYIYQSDKPYKTLPSSEIIRVYDKVPVRALSQEVISNRVVYGNFQDKHTPPSFLNYNVSATEKDAFSLQTGSGNVNGAIANPSTTIILNNATGVIKIGSIVTGTFTQATAGEVVVVTTTGGVSPTITTNIALTVANAVVLSFKPIGPESNTTSVIEYPSSSLKTNRNYQVGIVLSDRFGRQSTTILSNSTASISVGENVYIGSTLYSPYIGTGQDRVAWPGNSLKILFNDPIGPADKSGTSPGIYNGDSTSASYNPLGWYSYKVVVKQTEQEYYNVYTPGAMKGLPDLVNNSVDSPNTSLVVLINDNINKIPRDLSEVGPQDKTFRSSVRLFGRVQNTRTGGGGANIISKNSQYFPTITPFTTVAIENIFSTFDIPGSGTPPIDPTVVSSPYSSLFKVQSNPFLAEIVTTQTPLDQFGEENTFKNGPIYAKINTLAIFETEPIESALDIFWETTTSGLINNLNNIILTSSNGAEGFSTFNNSLFDEGVGAVGNRNVIDTDFRLINNLGANIPSSQINSFVMDSVFNNQDPPQQVFGSGVANPYFTFDEVAPAGSKVFNINVTDNFINNIYFSSTASTTAVFDFTFTSEVEAPNTSPVTTTTTLTAALKNIAPTIIPPQGEPSTGYALDSSVTQSTPVTNLTGVNGAWSGNPNRGRGLTWSVNEVTTAADLSVSLLSSNLFSVSFTNTGVLSTCNLNRTGGTTPADNYIVTLRLTDDNNEFKEIPITVRYVATVPSVGVSGAVDCQQITDIQQSGIPDEIFYYSYVILKVDNGLHPGFYLYFAGALEGDNAYKGWETLQDDTDANGNIQIDYTNSTKAPNGTCQSSRWFSGATADVVWNKMKGCEIPQNQTPDSTDTRSLITINPITNYTFTVV